MLQLPVPGQELVELAGAMVSDACENAPNNDPTTRIA
jgi:hypothetical protein